MGNSDDDARVLLRFVLVLAFLVLVSVIVFVMISGLLAIHESLFPTRPPASLPYQRPATTRR